MTLAVHAFLTHNLHAVHMWAFSDSRHDVAITAVHTHTKEGGAFVEFESYTEDASSIQVRTQSSHSSSANQNKIKTNVQTHSMSKQSGPCICDLDTVPYSLYGLNILTQNPLTHTCKYASLVYFLLANRFFLFGHWSLVIGHWPCATRCGSGRAPRWPSATGAAGCGSLVYARASLLQNKVEDLLTSVRTCLSPTEQSGGCCSPVHTRVSSLQNKEVDLLMSKYSH